MSRFVEPTEEEAQKFMEGQTSEGSARFQEPTEEEAQEFVAKQEPVPYQPTEQDFGAMDAAKLMGQGLTYENMDEILGALKATKKTAFGDEKISDWLETYKRERDLEREEFKRLHEQYPKSSFVAEGIGAVYSPINKVLGPAKAAAGAFQAIKSGALTAGKAGLLTGIGASEQDISKPVEYAKDIAGYGATGAALGGGLGGLGHGAGQGLSWLEDQIRKGGPFASNALTAFLESAKGKGFISPKSMERIQKMSSDAARKFGDIIYGEEGPIAKSSKEISAYFQRADESGVKVPGVYDPALKDLLSGLIQSLEQNNLLRGKRVLADISSESPEIGNILKLLNRGDDVNWQEVSSGDVAKFLTAVDELVNGTMSPSQTYNFARWLQGEQVPEFSTQLTTKKFKELIPDALPQSLKKSAKIAADEALGFPASEQIFNKYKDVRTATAETVLNKGEPVDLSTVWQNEFSRETILAKLKKEFNDIVKDLSKPSVTGDDARKTINALKVRVNELNQKYPDLKLNLDDFFTELSRASEQSALRQKFLPHEAHSDAGDLVSRLTNLTGYGIPIVLGKAASVPLALNNLIVKADDKVLIPLAQKLKQTPTLQHIGQALEDGVQNKSGKNAALFMIMQNPQARSIANQMLGVDQNEKR